MTDQKKALEYFKASGRANSEPTKETLARIDATWEREHGKKSEPPTPTENVTKSPTFSDTEPPTQPATTPKSVVALWNLARESEYSRTGKLPSNDWLNHSVKWWLRFAAELHSYDQPDAELIALAAAAPTGQSMQTPLERLGAALNGMEGYPLNFRAHDLLRELNRLVAAQIKEEREAPPVD